MKLPRRNFLHLAAGAAAIIPVLLAETAVTQAQTSPDMRVTLLGTGTPLPRADRFGPSTLIEAGSEKLVFDCGRGCPIRLQQKAFRSRR
jgi:ribonuclease Z